jgi:hypothetical protein
MFETALNPTVAPFKSVQEATSFLTAFAKQEGIAHLSYWYLQYVEGTPDQVIWVATYDPAYMSLYMSKFTPLDDPVISSVMDDKYVDWAEWWDHDALAQAVNDIVARYGITKYGFSMPLPAPGQDKIIFSLCTRSNDAEWPALRGALARRFMPFAQNFDARMRHLVDAGHQGESVFRLSA